MVMGIDTAAVTGLMMLASADCSAVTQPQVHIQPRSADIQYEFRYSSEELTRLKRKDADSRALGADMVTGGLREDEPRLGVNISWKMQEYTYQDAACIWYDKINVTIDLAPKIYIAKEFNYSPCREEILKHEKQHVRVDRQVFNKYSKQIATAVERAIKAIDVAGPYRKAEIPRVQETMAKHIQHAVMTKISNLQTEMKRRQAQVDSPQEYARITKICRAARY